MSLREFIPILSGLETKERSLRNAHRVPEDEEESIRCRFTGGRDELLLLSLWWKESSGWLSVNLSVKGFPRNRYSDHKHTRVKKTSPSGLYIISTTAETRFHDALHNSSTA